jgi:hypothetical protein
VAKCGVHAFDSLLVLRSLGSQRLTVQDLDDSTIFGSWDLNVLAG